MNKPLIAGWIGPTNTKGTRIVVYTENTPRRYYGWNYALDADQNYLTAATKYAAEKGWQGTLVPDAWGLPVPRKLKKTEVAFVFLGE